MLLRLQASAGLATDACALCAGGQKVKVVLAAAMWNCPHLLVLDEPTNYLDRDSLGALAEGIRTFDGGVIMISHNAGTRPQPEPCTPLVYAVHPERIGAMVRP